MHSIDDGYENDAVGAVNQLLLCSAAIGRPDRLIPLGIQLPCFHGGANIQRIACELTTDPEIVNEETAAPSR